MEQAHQVVKFVISAAQWNRGVRAPAYEASRLQFDFADAVSPAQADRSGRSQDTRVLAVGFYQIRFAELRP